ncbi:MAG: (2Fe-2S)-binding protein [Proteobacteria bacterium]|nr:(2Fe-2S)-binding protein [Pseudomonadota bacterium]MBU4275764.1 (2Fe-2S)-binding protein [Pseudomonadota bacterium]MBU4383799.1 (2Fe-2S)-binding protein [Pseudomonadota bacterium]MBU4605896.1 (2Fe-2S)-binding protein [Pseudomonadota bacterium]MCG2763441.1 (2Fe-2S)-binding protein [Desulfarculaceae bacterium]
MSKQAITLTVNGVARQALVEPNQTLTSLLRDELGLTGTKHGCGVGDCGCCTVILDNETVNSCLVLAMQAQGREVLTIEGLAKGAELHPLQQAFVDAGAIQCGFCTPGMILSAKALLERTPRPSREEITKGLSGNLCRCTGYEKIVEAVQDAADKMSEA